MKIGKNAMRFVDVALKNRILNGLPVYAFHSYTSLYDGCGLSSHHGGPSQGMVRGRKIMVGRVLGPTGSLKKTFPCDSAEEEHRRPLPTWEICATKMGW